jgi:hypothetical protein
LRALDRVEEVPVRLDRRLIPLVGLALAAALAGCGPKAYKTDVRAFTQESKTPAGQEVLRSIATYRVGKDVAHACTLVTAHFMSGRFGGSARNCAQVIRSGSRHLPDRATVESITGNSARVRIAEPTATRSIYEMKREGGVWKIDDIVEPR